MAKRAVVRSLFVSALFSTAALFAASPWTPVGPPGGAVFGLSIDPKDANVLYAGTSAGGIWKSKDGGANWTRLSGVAAEESVDAIAVSPADSKIVLAGGSSGMYRSADAGATWKKVLDQGQRQPSMTGLAFDPSKPATVYASSDSDGHPKGVFKSTDAGATWQPANGGIHENSRVWGVAVARDGKSVWAASSDGVYQSDDGGAAWTVVLPGKAALSIAAGAGGLVVAGTQGDGIMRSGDGGKSWAETTNDAPESGNTAYALLASTATADLLYAGIPNRILRSTDGGVTWKTFSRGFNWIGFRSLAIDEKSGVVWGGTGRDGVVKTTDGGATWTTGAGFLSLGTTSIVIDPASAKRIFVGTVQGGVHRSEDGGATWALSNEGMTNRSVHSIAAQAGTPGVLLAGTRKGAFRSTDGGASWTHVLKGGCEPEVQNLRFAPSNPKRVWVHTGRSLCQLMRSDDGGLTWKEMKTPRPDSSMRGHFAFHVNATDPDRIAFNTDRSLHLSADGGTTWTTSTGIPPTSRIQAVVTGKSPEDLIAATNKGIYQSANGGNTWTAAGSGVENLNVRRIVFDPASGTIWAGAWREGILRSTDEGKSWFRIGGEPPHPDVIALALESPKALLVGLDGGGVYRLDLASATATPLKGKGK